MMKKAYFIIFFYLLFTLAIDAQNPSMADSLIYYLQQVKGIQNHKDSALLEKAADALFQTQY
jgi:hypothetical protein